MNFSDLFGELTILTGLNSSGYKHLITNLWYDEAIKKGDAFFISSDRASILLFHKFLDERAITSFTAKKNVSFLKNLNEIKDNDSYIVKEHSDIIKDFNQILDGMYTIKPNGSIHFIYSTGVETSLEHTSCNSVRSLFILSMYLNHVAEKDQILIIEEPELHLHPENKIKLSRILARLSNIGIKVLLTTNCDYILKEINSLIMLSNKIVEKSVCKEKWGNFCEEYLNPKNVKAFSITKPLSYKKENIYSYISLLEKSSTLGIVYPDIDKVINSLNCRQDYIYYELKEKQI